MENDVTPSPKSSGSRLPFLAVGALILALVAGGGYFAWQSFQSASQVTADVMPAETNVYMSMDFLGLITNDYDGAARIQHALEPFLDEIGSESGEDTLQQSFQDEVLTPLNMTVEEDIASWVGRSVGIGLMDIAFLDDLSQVPNTTLALEIRAGTGDQADQFLTKLVENYPTLPDGNPMAEQTYEGVVYYVEQSEEPFVIGRAGDLMIVTSAEAGMKQAIDTQQGAASLADEASYQAVLAELPEERIMTLYLNVGRMVEGVEPVEQQDAVQSLLDESGITGMGAVPSPDDFSAITDICLGLLASDQALTGFGGAGFFDELGLRGQFVMTYDKDKLDANSSLSTAKNNLSSGKVASTLPQETMAYIASRNMMTTYWELYQQMDADAFAEAMQLAEETVGFNPDVALMPRMGEEFAIAVYKSDQGSIASDPTINIDLGVAILQEIKGESSALSAEVFQPLNTTISDFMFLPIETYENDGQAFYTIMNTFGEEPTPMLTYGVNDEYLMFGTSLDELTTMFGTGAKLPENPHFSALSEQVNAADGVVQLFFDLDLICTLSAMDQELCRLGEHMNAFAMAGTAKETAYVGDIYLLLDEVEAAAE
ncbi:MAG: DUF3352 domain-containing protein [Candidatus Promineifilaceae bacterium]